MAHPHAVPVLSLEVLGWLVDGVIFTSEEEALWEYEAHRPDGRESVSDQDESEKVY